MQLRDLFVIHFRLIRSTGPSKAISVTFVIPLFAVAFGAVFIGEAVTASMVAGGIVIAIGTALATGLVRAGSLWRKSQAFAARALVVVVIVGALDDTPMDVHAAEIDTSIDTYTLDIVSRDEPGTAGGALDLAGHEIVRLRLRRPPG